MPKVRFVDGDDGAAGASVEVAAETTLFDAGAAAKVTIETACIGKGTCGLCRVKVLAGDASLSPYTEEETKHLGNLYHLSKLRLACRTRVLGDGVVVQPVRRPAKKKK